MDSATPDQPTDLAAMSVDLPSVEVGKHLPNKPDGKSTDIAAKSVGWRGGTVKTSTQKRMCKHLQLLIRETPET